MTRGRFDHVLGPRALLALLVLLAIAPPAIADQLAPATEFTIRNGNEVDSDPFGIFGFIQDGRGAQDETFVEFDLASLSEAIDVDLELTVRAQQTALTFDVSTYAGSGTPSLSPSGTGTLLTTLPLNLSQFEQTYSIDLTSRVAAAIADGHAFLGIRLHDPAGIPPGSDHVPFVWYDSATLLYSVPEPSTFVLLGTALAALLACGRRRRSGTVHGTSGCC